MSTSLRGQLTEPLLQVRTRPLLTMQLEVSAMLLIGETPGVNRRIGVVSGGRFEGERLSGRVLDGGNDWQSVRSDGSTFLDVRLNLQTDDGHLIAATYRGLRHGPREVIEKLERGETVDPASYYFRVAPMFETASPKYGWLNGLLAIGLGHRLPGGPIYNLFELL